MRSGSARTLGLLTAMVGSGLASGPVWAGPKVMGAPAEAPFQARVVRVLDGDTLEVLEVRDGVRIPRRLRLHGIDCPEKTQPFGQRAKTAALELSGGKTVRVLPRDRDRYGRTIAEVELPDGKSLNRELVRLGLAWWYRKYAPRDAELERLEAEARAAKRGLWSLPEPQPPWEFRQARRGKAPGRP
jgi:endonuclease YncB( thermonuclease family)